MSASARSIQVSADRDSVCAGDDSESHEVTFHIAPSAKVLDLLAAAWRACPLAGIAGGKSTWLLEIGNSGKCIGVMAQQWLRPKLLISDDTSTAELFSSAAPSLYFRYWLQCDPIALFAALESNAPLPSRHA